MTFIGRWETKLGLMTTSGIADYPLLREVLTLVSPVKIQFSCHSMQPYGAALTPLVPLLKVPAIILVIFVVSAKHSG